MSFTMVDHISCKNGYKSKFEVAAHGTTLHEIDAFMIVSRQFVQKSLPDFKSLLEIQWKQENRL